MSALDKKWNGIIEKIRLILERNQALDKEVAHLRASLERMESQKNQLLREKEALNNQINVLKLAKDVGLSERDRVEVKKQIKHYINEIDDCLAKMSE
jgi:chromosome segregation ATPase